MTIEHVELGAGIAHRHLDGDVRHGRAVAVRDGVVANDKPAPPRIDQCLPAQTEMIEVFLVLRQERKFDAPPGGHFSVVDLLRRQPQLLDPLMAQIDHEGEIDFPLGLAGDLEDDDPGRVGIFYAFSRRARSGMFIQSALKAGQQWREPDQRAGSERLVALQELRREFRRDAWRRRLMLSPWSWFWLGFVGVSVALAMVGA
jgi:hypothetical protein